MESIRARKSETTSAAAERALDAPSWIQNGLWVIASAIWAIFGLVLWIPYVARQLALFLLIVPRVALAGGSVQDAETRVRDSTGFYKRGFNRIRKLRGETVPTYAFSSSGRRRKEEKTRRLQGWLQLTGEVLFAVVFWSAVEYVVRDASTVVARIAEGLSAWL